MHYFFFIEYSLFETYDFQKIHCRVIL